MSESEGKLYGFTTSTPGAPGTSKEPIKIELVGLPITGEIAVNPPARPKNRAGRKWQPTKRQRAILSLPAPSTRKMSLREYCSALDKKTPFPAELQTDGKPGTHQEAWESGDEDLRNKLKCERFNAWKAFRAG